MSLRVDYRRGSVELLEPLRRLGLPVKKCTLEYGDFSFRGHGPDDSLVRVGVERKVLSDLLACIVDNRFAGHQLPGLIESYDVRYLVVEGHWRPGHDGILQHGFEWVFKRDKNKVGLSWRDAGHSARGWMYAAVDGYLTTVEQQGHVHVIHTSTPTETAYWLMSRYRWWDEEWSKHKALQPMLKQIRTRTRDPRKDDQPEAVRFAKASVFRKMLAQIPSIGWVRSAAVEQHFGSLIHAIHAPEEEWISIPGIGPAIARQARRELRDGLTSSDSQWSHPKDASDRVSPSSPSAPASRKSRKVGRS